MPETAILKQQPHDEPAFSIDRTEVTNAAFRMLVGSGDATAIAMPMCLDTPFLRNAGGDDYPVANISWSAARDYCRFLGKELPTDSQWQKAARGGAMLGATPNPAPHAQPPWGDPIAPVPANLRDTGPGGPTPVGSRPGDASPYGVLDLAGNLKEWTATEADAPGFMIVRGCDWDKCKSTDLVKIMPIQNNRDPQFLELRGRLPVRGPAEP